MGFLADIFAEKVLLWEGKDEELYEAYKTKLKEAKIKNSAFTKNQQTPKCDGNCGMCPMAAREFGTETPFYEKFGNACDSSVDILNKKESFEIYDIYVKKSEIDKAKNVCGIA